jgi:hypothetical protein
LIGLEILQGRKFQDWHNSNLNVLKSTIDQIDDMHKILAMTMVYGVSFDYVNGYAINTSGGVIYKGNSYVIPVQKIRAPKDGQYVYLKNIETGEIAVSANSTQFNLARFHNGAFDYSVRSSLFNMDTTELIASSEGSIRFDRSKGVFAVYHSGDWLYEKRTPIVYTSTGSFSIDAEYDVEFNCAAIYPCSFFALLRYSAESETAVGSILKIEGVTKDSDTSVITDGSTIKLECDSVPTQFSRYKITINPASEISVDSIICGFVVGG